MPIDPVTRTFSISTLGDLIDEGYKITAHCRSCNAGTRAVDLKKVAAIVGRDWTYIGRGRRWPIHCRDCGCKDFQIYVTPSRKA